MMKSLNQCETWLYTVSMDIIDSPFCSIAFLSSVYSSLGCHGPFFRSFLLLLQPFLSSGSFLLRSSVEYTAHGNYFIDIAEAFDNTQRKTMDACRHNAVATIRHSWSGGRGMVWKTGWYECRWWECVGGWLTLCFGEKTMGGVSILGEL